MRKLPKPQDRASTILTLCANSVRDPGLSNRLRSAAVVNAISMEETQYDTNGANASLYSISASATLANTISTSEMISLYTNTFVQGNNLRSIYNKIKSAPKNGICPLCGQRVVSTLDHYLPKSSYASLAVTPVNLVPSCSDCNKRKLAVIPRTASEQTFHPYYDDPDDATWLVASVAISTPPSLVFSVTQPVGWSKIKYNRAQKHFTTYGLGQLYATHAAEELTNISHVLSIMSEERSARLVQQYLEEQAASRKAAARNSWQAAMYQALCESSWFCSQGCLLIT